jgi:hypothetical protein
VTKLFALNASPLTRNLRKSSKETIRSVVKAWRILLNNSKRPYVGRRARRSKRLLSIFLQDFAVAAVSRLKERGDPWRLNEEAPTAKPPST